MNKSSLVTINPELEREWHPTKNGDLRLDIVTCGSEQKVWWRCKLDHEWEASIYNRSRLGRGCPICSNKLILKGYNDLDTINPELAKEWHPTLNGNITPDMIFPNTNKKYWWLGRCGHEWESVVNSRNSGIGCPYCSNKKVLAGFNDLGTTDPELAKEWHPTLNGKMKVSDVVAGSEKIVWWHCHNCGLEWKQSIYNRTRRKGYPHCDTKKL